MVGKQTCIRGHAGRGARRRPGNNLIASSCAQHHQQGSLQVIQRRVRVCDGYSWVSRALHLAVPITDLRSIYKEIGPGRRVALSKLAVEKFEETGRPLRIAIDTSIWLFQIQASKGRRIHKNTCDRSADGCQVVLTRLCEPSTTAFFD